MIIAQHAELTHFSAKNQPGRLHTHPEFHEAGSCIRWQGTALVRFRRASISPALGICECAKSSLTSTFPNPQLLTLSSSARTLLQIHPVLRITESPSEKLNSHFEPHNTALTRPRRASRNQGLKPDIQARKATKQKSSAVALPTSLLQDYGSTSDQRQAPRDRPGRCKYCEAHDGHTRTRARSEERERTA